MNRCAIAGAIAASWALAGCAGQKADCIYTANSINALTAFQTKVNHTYDCAMVFDNANPTWADWEKPWLTTSQGNLNLDWASWVKAGTRDLIITLAPFPDSEKMSNWLARGAAHLYDAHARALAQNLVAAGLGNSVIRLAHEANDPSYPYSVANLNTAQLAQWVAMWRNEVLAMRSVPGAHFQFDWCINAYYLPVPLASWYPGDDVVDIVGIDAYDSGIPAGQDPWSWIYNQPDGIKAVQNFAVAHQKPLSIPEWGLAPASLSGPGPDPAYINHIADLVASGNVAYQAYFHNGVFGSLLDGDPASLNAYISRFGG